MRKWALLLAVLLLCSGCTAEHSYRYTVVGQFDTVIEVIGFSSQAETEKFGKQAEEELKYWHKLCDAYHAYDGVTGVYAINRAHDWVRIPQELAELLAFGIEGYARTGGAVNLMGGAVTRLWKDVEAPPDDGALQAALSHIDITALELDRENCRVRITDREAALDLGAFAKGYALQKTADKLAAAGFVGLLNATSSVVPVGERVARVGIADPLAGGYGPVVLLDGQSLATSGIYQRYFTYNDTDYHHIIDLHTGYPAANGIVQASVVAPDAAWADIWSTAALLTGDSDVSGLLIYTDGSQKTIGEWEHVTE